MTCLPLLLVVAQVPGSGEIQELISELGPIPVVSIRRMGTRPFRSPSQLAADKLGVIGAAAVDPLLQVVGKPADWADPHDPNAPRRAIAILTLGRIGERRANPALVEVLRHHPNPSERGAAILALSDLNASESIPDLIDSLGDRRSIGWERHLTVQWLAGGALRKFGPAVVPALGRAIEDPDPTRRLNAIYGAGFTTQKALAPKLARALKDSEPIRFAAVHSLRNCGDASSVRPLFPLLADPSDSIAEGAAEVLGGLRPHSKALLKAALSSPRPRIRRFALMGYCIGIPGSSELYRVVRNALRDPVPEVRYQATITLGNQNNLGINDQNRLKALCLDPDPRIRMRSQEILRSIASQIRLKTGPFE